jgi:hypothetical protein
LEVKINLLVQFSWWGNMQAVQGELVEIQEDLAQQGQLKSDQAVLQITDNYEGNKQELPPKKDQKKRFGDFQVITSEL